MHTAGPFRWDGVRTLRGKFGQAICRLPDYDREGPTDIAERHANEKLLHASDEMFQLLSLLGTIVLTSDEISPPTWKAIVVEASAKARKIVQRIEGKATGKE